MLIKMRHPEWFIFNHVWLQWINEIMLLAEVRDSISLKNHFRSVNWEMSWVTSSVLPLKTSSLERSQKNTAVNQELITPLRSTVDFLKKLLGFRWGDLRAGQLRVDVVRDRLNRHSQTGAAVRAQVAGGQLWRTNKKVGWDGLILGFEFLNVDINRSTTLSI